VKYDGTASRVTIAQRRGHERLRVLGKQTLFEVLREKLLRMRGGR
jgi:hypothetical protein